MRLYGLIGFPLSHSFSQSYFENKFADEDINDATYKLFPIGNISLLHSVINSNPNLLGLNVTIPFKEKIIPFIHSLHGEAHEIGAVNTISIQRNGNGTFKLTGYNTDVFGFEMSIKPLLKDYHTKALILGSGGASKAAAYALTKMNISYNIVSRNSLNPEHLHYNNLDKEIISSHLIIINASPVGMFPDVYNYPDIPYQYISSKHLLFDFIYNPDKTIFLNKGKEKNAVTVNGLKMLHLQADKAWQIWNNG